MYKQILVPVRGEAADAAVLATALLVGRSFAAHLLGLHARPDPVAATVGASAGGMADGYSVGLLLDAVIAEAAAGEASARAGFAAFCRDAGLATADAPGLAAELVVEIGDEAGWLTDYARTSDLLVIGRARGAEPVALDLLQEVLTGSGRPMLLAPIDPPQRPLARIAIAWKDGAEAARAVAAALPFIVQAREVVLLTVREPAEGDAASTDTVQRLQRTLLRHAPAVQLRPLVAGDAAPVEALLAAAVETDLLVMGGYGHGPLREAIFGGFTQHVLRAAALPILLMH